MNTFNWPILYLLHMVKHGPLILKISAWLHPTHQVDFAHKTTCEHLEHIDHVIAMPKQHAIVNVIVR
jgi:hypothetical protein